MRVADIFMSFPSIVLILVLVAVIGPSIWSVTIVIGVLGWTQFARLIYANVLSVSEKEYVESARAIGTSNYKIITKYILPNSFAPILIAITFQMASAILMESSLSFLGMGVQPPGASWGNMLYDASLYYKEMNKLYGKADYYSMDPFHEGGSVAGVDLDAAGNCAAYYGAQHQFPGRRNPGCSGSEDQNLIQVVISTHKRRTL